MENKKNVILAILIVGVISMTIAFAALSTNLSINGTADVASTTWNIHFQNWALDTAGTVTEGGVTHQNTADYPSVNQLSQTVSVANSTKVENLNVTLKQPGDYVKYTFEIINEGSIEASLNNFTHNMTCESGKTCNHLTYTVECKDSQENNVLTQYSTLYKNGGLAYCTLQVKYNEQTNTGNTVYTQEAVSATLSANWQYIQKVDNNSGNSGNQEPVTPSNPNETTFNGNYTYTSSGVFESNGYGFVPVEFNNEWNVFLRNDGTKNETCNVFPTGTVCLTNNTNGYYDDFSNVSSGTYDSTSISTSGLSGYSLNKAEEMLNKGASSCNVYGDYVDCNRPAGGNCSIGDNGRVYCSDGSNYCYVDNDGSVHCN